MCGIAGIYFFDGRKAESFPKSRQVLDKLKHRGPDNRDATFINQCYLFHTRLSIIDTSEKSNQPFKKGDNTLVFNGEIFNYQFLQSEVQNKITSGDVEVMHHLSSHEAVSVQLNKINGYFAFANYNEQNGKLIIGRDRLGIKPLYFYKNTEFFAFASELSALLEFCEPQPINKSQIYSYFRLNYCAGNQSIFENIYQVPPGYIIEIQNQDIQFKNWYTCEKVSVDKHSLVDLLEDAVRLRLIADVPVGCFLSGGLDSSIIAALSCKLHPSINTFSVGFENEEYFDETMFAQKVANHIGSKHHVLKISDKDFNENFYAFLDGIDEPFADSSAFNVYLLSKFTRKQVKVALSGDGADELFKGYHKHRALNKSGRISNQILAKTLFSVTEILPKSRNFPFGNSIRQLSKFRELVSLSDKDKLKFLAQISSDKDLRKLLKIEGYQGYFNNLFQVSPCFENFELENTIDIQVVLKDDMLVKADRFSMRNGLELRNPFLDYRIIEHALNLPIDEKIDDSKQKKILKELFEPLLPQEIFKRKKKGFELPLWKWLSKYILQNPDSIWFDYDFIISQGIFNNDAVALLKKKVLSNNPGDNPAKLYAYIVFQNWYIKNKVHIANA
ncbi:MAG: asparagine synthase (glutamine-hydrolyzing) [Bacteroidia bacterium]